MNVSEIENALRQAPQPRPPAGLKRELLEQVPPYKRDESIRQSHLEVPRSWFGRWWPALAAGLGSAACAAVLGLQQLEIRDLEQTIEILRKPNSGSAAKSEDPSGAVELKAAPAADPATLAAEEINKLKEAISKLSAEISRLEQLRSENQKLRTQLATAPAEFLTPEETAAVDKARAKALSVACVNNLKQLGLAVRVWSLDHGDLSPPAILEMTNEMSTPKILFCPADTGRQTASNWATYSSANCSYEYLAPSAPDTDPQRIVFRCPIHGHVCLVDGSVQFEVAKKHPERIIQHDGKLYLDAKPGP